MISCNVPSSTSDWENVWCISALPLTEVQSNKYRAAHGSTGPRSVGDNLEAHTAQRQGIADIQPRSALNRRLVHSRAIRATQIGDHPRAPKPANLGVLGRDGRIG